MLRRGALERVAARMHLRERGEWTAEVERALVARIASGRPDADGDLEAWNALFFESPPRTDADLRRYEADVAAWERDRAAELHASLPVRGLANRGAAAASSPAPAGLRP